MTRSKHRHYKADYARLFDDPGALFRDCKVTLFPNGEPEIWIQSGDGLGVRVRASNGKAGLGVEVRTFIGAPGLDAFPDMATRIDVRDARGIDIVQYRGDDASQAFRRWYHHDEGAEYPKD